MKLLHRFHSILITVVLPAVLLVGCNPKTTGSVKASTPAPPDPLAIVLAPEPGSGKIDETIRRIQGQVRQGQNRDAALEQLGWAFVAKARESFDPGYYKLAEQCALAIEQKEPKSDAALLLRGHVLDSLHHFHEAEDLARQLVERRGRGFDYGLLGDTLMEQGRLDEAVAAYQQMVNLHPDLHAYARAAHMRWLKGDLDGAIEAIQLAVGAATPNDPENAAWVNTRLATYEFQAGHMANAAQACDAALWFETNYPPALLLRGKMLLADNQPAKAVDVLQLAAQLNPLPEYQWTLADALREAGHGNEAAAVEARLRQRGAVADPRSFALFLATRHESTDEARRLAGDELKARGDIFTHDALAWALSAAGDPAEAQTEMTHALAEGTQDARLWFHAAVIAAQSGHDAEARDWIAKSEGISQMLLPSERNVLNELSLKLKAGGIAAASQPAKTISAF